MSDKIKDEFFIYGIYDTKQNKFRSDLTSRHKKWYESEKRARNALDDDRFSIGDLKIVKVECKIVEEINND